MALQGPLIGRNIASDQSMLYVVYQPNPNPIRSNFQRVKTNIPPSSRKVDNDLKEQWNSMVMSMVMRIDCLMDADADARTNFVAGAALTTSSNSASEAKSRTKEDIIYIVTFGATALHQTSCAHAHAVAGFTRCGLG